MDVFILAAKSALAVMLLVAGGAKLADVPGFAGTVRLFIPRRVSGQMREGIAVGIASIELLAGAVSLSAPGWSWVNVAVLALGCVFVAVSLVGYALYRGRSCRCFGALSRRKFDLVAILRSAVIAGLAAIAVLRVRPADIHLNAAEHALLLVVAVVLVAASFTAARALAVSHDAHPEWAGR